MAIFIDPLVILSQQDKTPWTVVSSDPGTGFDGQIIVNSTDLYAKVYFNNTWNIWFQFTAGAISYLLLESGFYLLQEDGSSKIIL